MKQMDYTVQQLGEGIQVKERLEEILEWRGK